MLVDLLGFRIVKHQTLAAFITFCLVVRRASDCIGHFTDANVAWQVRYPLDLNYAPCPFGGERTKYQATVWDGSKWHCENDESSVLEVVEGNRLEVNTCIHSNSFDQPLKGSTLYCKGYVAGTEVDASDNVLLLARKEGTTIKFYCGRYSKNGDELFLSLNTNYKSKPVCQVGASATTNDGGYIAFKLSRWAPNIKVPEKPTTLGLGPCSFPPRWRRVKWFIGYRARQGGADAHIYRFDDSSLRQVSTVNSWAADWMLSCDQADYAPPRYSYRMNGPECLSFTEVTKDVLIYKHIILGVRSPTLPMCIEELQQSAFTTLLVPYQNYTAEKIAEGKTDCPFPLSTYQTSFVDHNLERHCENNNQSTTTIGSSDMRIRSCVGNNGYETPYYVDLTCVASWRSSSVASTQPGEGDYLLLSYYDRERLRTHYYVARYKINGNKIYLSLHINGNGQQINFKTSATPYSSGPGYSSFTFTRMPSNECNCLFGDCTVRNGAKECRCYQGYVGVSCETSLPLGSCADENACKNAAECVDVPTNIGRDYFYCRCSKGYTGLQCELKDPCYPNPCSNGGECAPLGKHYKCTCRPSYYGDDCLRRLATIEESSDQDNTSTIVLTTTIGGVFIIAIIIAIVVCQKRLKRKEENLPVNPESDMPKQTPKMQAWYADYKDSYKAQMAATEEKTLEVY